MAYAAETYLDSLSSAGIRLGLHNIRELSARLGDPHCAFATIHVAGTNGKGSVAAYAAHALRVAGHRTGAFLSPRLLVHADQIRIDGVTVSSEAFAEAVLRVREAAAADVPLEPTQFEVLTASAFELFKRHGVAIAVIETGVGGALDATNIVTPIAAAITPISFDHAALLGDSLELIAAHKAGIAKPNVPAVIAPMDPRAQAIVERTARSVGAPIVRAAEGCTITTRMEDGRAIVAAVTPQGSYGPVPLALCGEYQVTNALVAIRVLEQVRLRGVGVDRSAIESALRNTSWPGRLELLEFIEGRRVLIDAAHNPDAAAALARHLTTWYPQRPPLVFAAMRDKDVMSMLQPLLSAVGAVVVTTAPSPRTSAPEDLAAVVHTLDPMRPVAVEPDPLRAVELAWAQGNTICVAGSLFLAGAVRGALHGRAIVGSSR